MKPLCDCEPCRRRRAAQNRWLEKIPGRKAERIRRSNAIRAKRRRAAAANTPQEVSDEELDRRALQSWRPEWNQ